ncbi:hypothetical protein BC937DRAFT_89159 [Endogone sp. FLAS-F59071]|nr:hypothetical protein BC937DRAFT_89159 [Endogone sp. FLAS-F59071]|eukprot:RUS18086.1 hypothetical protein BC937DRAFT_89159 [Endogone sp. FLAS-F59071]
MFKSFPKLLAQSPRVASRPFFVAAVRCSSTRVTAQSEVTAEEEAQMKKCHRLICHFIFRGRADDASILEDGVDGRSGWYILDFLVDPTPSVYIFVVHSRLRQFERPIRNCTRRQARQDTRHEQTPNPEIETATCALDCGRMGFSNKCPQAPHTPCLYPKSSFRPLDLSFHQTSLVSRAIDAFHPATTHDPKVRLEVITRMVNYLDTDTVLYHQEYPESLVALQERDWVPVIEWARREHGVELFATTHMVALRQPEGTKARLRGVLEAMDPIELAAFERTCMTSKSFLIALALVKKAITVEEAARAAHVEVNSQIERWGMVEDSHDVDREDMRKSLGSAACAVKTEK